MIILSQMAILHRLLTHPLNVLAITPSVSTRYMTTPSTMVVAELEVLLQDVASACQPSQVLPECI